MDRLKNVNSVEHCVKSCCGVQIFHV